MADSIINIVEQRMRAALREMDRVVRESIARERKLLEDAKLAGEKERAAKK